MGIIANHSAQTPGTPLWLHLVRLSPHDCQSTRSPVQVGSELDRVWFCLVSWLNTLNVLTRVLLQAYQNVHSPYVSPPDWECHAYPKMWDETFANSERQFLSDLRAHVWLRAS